MRGTPLALYGAEPEQAPNKLKFFHFAQRSRMDHLAWAALGAPLWCAPPVLGLDSHGRYRGSALPRVALLD
jgi:hypothetical protein